MRAFEKRPFQREADLLKVYREADARARYLIDTDKKLLSYHKVIDFCLNSEKCLQNESIKKNLVLFWTYKHIGDLFLEKHSDDFEKSNMLNALSAYEKALEFAKDENETLPLLMKIRGVYQDLSDKNMSLQSTVNMVELLDDALKIETFLGLADEASNKREEAYFLEQALRFVSDEKISVLKKCKNTMIICERLLEIYEKAGLKIDATRIALLKEQAGKMLLE